MGHFSRIFPTSLLLALPLATSLGGCTEPNPDYVEPTPPCASGQRYLAERVEFAAANKVDILVVVEKTADMDATQAALGASLGGLVDRLKADASLDWQLGVTSADTTDGGPYGRRRLPRHPADPHHLRHRRRRRHGRLPCSGRHRRLALQPPARGRPAHVRRTRKRLEWPGP